MKIALDQNLPPKLVGVIIGLFEDGPKHDVCSSKKYEPELKTPDLMWIQRFAAEGGQVVISGEKEMRSVPHVIKGIEETGVVAYFVPGAWSQFKMEDKAGYVLIWWNRIVDHAASAPAGSCWMIPNTQSGSFRRITYEKT